MKFGHQWFATLFLLLSSGAVAQSPAVKPGLAPKQIVEAAIEAMGGRKPQESPKTLIFAGVIEDPDEGIKYEFTTMCKGDMRLDTTNVPGVGRTRSGFDGKVHWEDDPFEGLRRVGSKGRSKAKPGVEDPLEKMNVANELNLKDYRALESKGVEKVGGRPAYAIRMARKKGAAVVRFFDCETFLLLREYEEGKNGAIASETLYSDYKTALSGCRVPFSISCKSGGHAMVFRVSEYKLNEPIDDSVFAYPGTATGH